MTAKIKRCRSHMFWYKQYIGDTFEVSDTIYHDGSIKYHVVREYLGKRNRKHWDVFITSGSAFGDKPTPIIYHEDLLLIENSPDTNIHEVLR